MSPIERIYRHRTPAEAELVRVALAEGAVDEASSTYLGQGINGPRRAFQIDHPLVPGLRGVPKPIEASGAHEVFGYEVARAMGIDGVFAAVARRPDGSAMIEYVEGRHLVSAGASDADGLETVIEEAIRTRSPGTPIADATRDARLTRQMIQAFDVIYGNPDRHGANGLIDAQRGVIALIDHGMIGGGDAPAVRAAYTIPSFSRPNAIAELPLSGDALQVLGLVDRDRIARAGDQLIADAAGRFVGKTAAASPDLVTQILRRLDQTLATGMLRFRPRAW